MTTNIQWLGHDCFRIGDEKVIYIDPYQIDARRPADLILITHEHFDHFSAEDVARLRQPYTAIVTIPAVASQLDGDVLAVRPGDRVTAAGTAIEVVPAYNVNKFRSPGVPFHPRENGGVGFVVTVGGQRIYHAGDTDLIPEMNTIKTDIALLPVSGVYVMTADEAAEAAEIIKPALAIPMHYGSIAGSESDALRFADLCLAKDIKVEILDWQ